MMSSKRWRLGYLTLGSLKSRRAIITSMHGARRQVVKNLQQCVSCGLYHVDSSSRGPEVCISQLTTGLMMPKCEVVSRENSSATRFNDAILVP